jgi:hypothetical protein
MNHSKRITAGLVVTSVVSASWILFFLSYTMTDMSEYRAIASGQPIVPEAPKGLKIERVRPLLQDSDAKTAALAGYLLALLGEGDALPLVVTYWRTHAQDDIAWTRLVYRAITALNDDSQVPVLEEIYGRFKPDDYEVREFYWTIRSMKGPRVLQLRERIRRDVGLNRLR